MSSLIRQSCHFDRDFDFVLLQDYSSGLDVLNLLYNACRCGCQQTNKGTCSLYQSYCMLMNQSPIPMLYSTETSMSATSPNSVLLANRLNVLCIKLHDKNCLGQRRTRPDPTRGWTRPVSNSGLDWAVFYVPAENSIGYTGDAFYRSKDSTNSIKVLKEQTVHRQIKHTISRQYMNTKHSKTPSLQ